MNIAIIAHDVKKELMTQFCIAYAGILSQHNLCATGTTGKVVSEATGLKIQSFLSGDMEPIEADLLRLCNVHNVPVATNIATAEALIHSLARGDLDWRDIVNPKKQEAAAAAEEAAE